MPNSNDEQLYLDATQEVDSGTQEPALLAKAMALAEGDQEEAKYHYIVLRIENLSNTFAVAPPSAKSPLPQSDPISMNYAGFWKRVAAFIIDYIIALLVLFVLSFVLGSIMAVQETDDPAVFVGAVYILEVIYWWIYFAVMESSPTQGTLGKMAIGIKVTDLEGSRISFGRASGRHFGKLISGLILQMGFVMVAFTKKKQGLHDRMASCLVVNK